MKYIFYIAFFLIFSCFCVACSSMRAADIAEAKKSKKIAIINIELGMAYIEKGDMQRAKQKLLYAIKKAPELPEAWYSIAYFCEVTGNKAEAQADYLKAIKLAPHRGDTLNNYGTFLCRQGRYQDSIQYFLAAIKDPQYLETASAYENAGLCAEKIPNKSLAIQLFQKALAESPSLSVSKHALTKLQAN